MHGIASLAVLQKGSMFDGSAVAQFM
jgi:hypothetical protein